MAVTIKDVARHAGVSVRTVSRAVNNMSDVSGETRKKILSVASELGYRPSLLARALVTHRSRTLGLVLPHITNPYFSEVAQGIFNAARENGLSVLLNNCSWASLPDLEGWYTLADHAVEGLITDLLYGHEGDIQKFSRFLSPIVVLNHPFTASGISSVMADIQDGAVQAMNYLMSKGHKKIGMIAPTVDHPERVDRVTVYINAMLENGQEPCILFIDANFPEPDIEAGYQTGLELLNGCNEITAIFCYNDLLALGAIRACREVGRHVPDDCAIVGFDDIAFASVVHPALTTVRVDKQELGRQAVHRLLEMLEHPQEIFQPLRLETNLIMRESA